MNCLLTNGYLLWGRVTVWQSYCVAELLRGRVTEGQSYNVNITIVHVSLIGTVYFFKNVIRTSSLTEKHAKLLVHANPIVGILYSLSSWGRTISFTTT